MRGLTFCAFLAASVAAVFLAGCGKNEKGSKDGAVDDAASPPPSAPKPVATDPQGKQSGSEIEKHSTPVTKKIINKKSQKEPPLVVEPPVGQQGSGAEVQNVVQEESVQSGNKGDQIDPKISDPKEKSSSDNAAEQEEKANSSEAAIRPHGQGETLAADHDATTEALFHFVNADEFEDLNLAFLKSFVPIAEVSVAIYGFKTYSEGERNTLECLLDWWMVHTYCILCGIQRDPDPYPGVSDPDIPPPPEPFAPFDSEKIRIRSEDVERLRTSSASANQAVSDSLKRVRDRVRVQPLFVSLLSDERNLHEISVVSESGEPVDIDEPVITMPFFNAFKSMSLGDHYIDWDWTQERSEGSSNRDSLNSYHSALGGFESDTEVNDDDAGSDEKFVEAKEGEKAEIEQEKANEMKAEEDDGMLGAVLKKAGSGLKKMGKSMKFWE